MKHDELRTLSVHKEHELLLKLEVAGLTDELADMIICSKDNELATKIVKLTENGGFEPTTSQKSAREIMSKNFFGIEEAIKYYGVNPTSQQRSALAEIPFSEAVLQECKDTHILIAIFPVSVLDIRGKVQDKKLFYSQDWYNKESFAKERKEIGWQLIRKEPVANSTSKNWEEQQALLNENEEVPSAQVMIYTIIGHFLNTGERLFEKIYVRTSSVGSDGFRVLVGGFDSDGLAVFVCWGGDRHVSLGVASARK